MREVLDVLHREFVYLSLCNTEGETDVFLGEETEIFHLDSFLASMNNAEQKVTLEVAITSPLFRFLA